MANTTDTINKANKANNDNIPQNVQEATRKVSELQYKYDKLIASQKDSPAIVRFEMQPQIDAVKQQLDNYKKIVDDWNKNSSNSNASSNVSSNASSNASSNMWPFDGLSKSQIEEYVRDTVRRAKENPETANNLYNEMQNFQQQAIQLLKQRYPRDGIYYDKSGRILPSKKYVKEGDSAAIYLNMIYGTGLFNLSQARQLDDIRQNYYNKNIATSNPLITSAESKQLYNSGNVVNDLRQVAHDIAHCIDDAALQLQYNKVAGYNTAMYNCRNKMKQLSLLQTDEMSKYFARMCVAAELTRCTNIWQLGDMAQYRNVLLRMVDEASQDAKLRAWRYRYEGLDAMDNNAQLNFAGDYTGGQ